MSFLSGKVNTVFHIFRIILINSEGKNLLKVFTIHSVAAQKNCKILSSKWGQIKQKAAKCWSKWNQKADANMKPETKEYLHIKRDTQREDHFNIRGLWAIRKRAMILIPQQCCSRKENYTRAQKLNSTRTQKLDRLPAWHITGSTIIIIAIRCSALNALKGACF